MSVRRKRTTHATNSNQNHENKRNNKGRAHRSARAERWAGGTPALRYRRISSAPQLATNICRETFPLNVRSESGSKLHALQTPARSCCGLLLREAFGVRPAYRRYVLGRPRRDLLRKILSTNLTAVGTSRCDVPSRQAAGGIPIISGLNAARTAQRAVPTSDRSLEREVSFRRNLSRSFCQFFCRDCLRFPPALKSSTPLPTSPAFLADRATWTAPAARRASGILIHKSRWTTRATSMWRIQSTERFGRSRLLGQ